MGILFAYMSVHQKPEEGAGEHLNSGGLGERPVLLTAEPSLQPLELVIFQSFLKPDFGKV